MLIDIKVVKILSQKIYLLITGSQLKGANIAIWRFDKKRLIPELWPACVPSFKINKSDEILEIGSCFVRDIEERLADLGYNIPMMNLSVPKTERKASRAGIFNIFSPAGIYQIITRLGWLSECRTLK